MSSSGFTFPYVPPSNLEHVFTLERAGKLPKQLTPKELVHLAISTGNTSRMLQAVQTFRLIDEAGYLMHHFHHLVSASESDYCIQLSTIIQTVYVAILAQLPNLATVTDAQLLAAFEQFTPLTQHVRRATLFRWLCFEAGLMAGSTTKMWRYRRVSDLMLRLLNQLPAND